MRFKFRFQKIDNRLIALVTTEDGTRTVSLSDILSKECLPDKDYLLLLDEELAKIGAKHNRQRVSSTILGLGHERVIYREDDTEECWALPGITFAKTPSVAKIVSEPCTLKGVKQNDPFKVVVYDLSLIDDFERIAKRVGAKFGIETVVVPVF